MCRWAVKVKPSGGLPARYRDISLLALHRQHRIILIRVFPRAVVTVRLVLHTHNRRDRCVAKKCVTIRSAMMDELNGRMIACQILITGLIARVANETPDPLRFLTEFRDEVRAVVKGVNIAGMDNTDRVRLVAQQTIDELFSLMKPPSSD